MPKRTRKRRTRKQKVINMIGCSQKHRHSKSCKNKNKKDLECPNCGPNCSCGPNCACPHPCPGTCYLNRRKKSVKKGGSVSGCGSCGCPVGGLTYDKMNKFGGGYPEDFNKPVLQSESGGFGPIPGRNQFGGNCGGTCGLQAGGRGAAPIPGPFVGSPWGAPVNQWPGANGIGSDRNYLSNYKNVINNDPQLQMQTSDADAGYKTLSSMVGGYRYDKNKNAVSKANSVSKAKANSVSNSKANSVSNSKAKAKAQMGGGLIPQDLVNLGSNFTYNLKSAYNSLNGYSAPVNPMPYKDQLPGNLNNRNLF